MKRYVAIWFPYLSTDWFTLKEKELAKNPFVLTSPDHGRMVIGSINREAKKQGIEKGMVLADARAIYPNLKAKDLPPGLNNKLLTKIASWSIRFTPSVMTDVDNDGIILDTTGCAHLWGDEKKYIEHIAERLMNAGYFAKISMADTIGAAWALSRFGEQHSIASPSKHIDAVLHLPPAALRLPHETLLKFYKLGIRTIKDLIHIPKPALRRRFGEHLVLRLLQATGDIEEIFTNIYPPSPFEERFTCTEPVTTRNAIDEALKILLKQLCERMISEGKGLRKARLSCFRIDNKIQSLEITTGRPNNNIDHLFKLFELKLDKIEPAEGIEVFHLNAIQIDDARPSQESLWENVSGLNDPLISELLDRIKSKTEVEIMRFLPAEHYWPERSVKPSASLTELPAAEWRIDKPRPLILLNKPDLIDVTAPIPDYPPMLFRYKKKLHKIIRADGPERIEQEWWLNSGEHRDYYHLEDEEGQRYWVFRSGHYTGDRSDQWYLHGFFS